MANISAGMVKELRDQTGAGMMDCKAALTENDGNLEAAVDWLRKKGLSKAAKKAGRVAAEGLIGVAVSATKGVVVEVNSETDFVARNDLFQGLVKMIANVALDTGPDVDKILAAKAGSITIADAIADTIAKIGENMTLRRAAELSVGKGVGRKLRAQLGRPTGSARSACSSRSNSTGKADELKAFGRHGRDACRGRQSAGDRSVRSRSGDRSSARRTCSPKSQGAGQAGQRDREDRRVRAQDLLQGGLPARSGLRPSTRARSPWRRPSRRPKARSARRSRSRASCALRSARASTSRPAISAARSRRCRHPLGPSVLCGFRAQTR